VITWEKEKKALVITTCPCHIYLYAVLQKLMLPCSLSGSGAETSEEMMVEDHNLYNIVVKERINVQKRFHKDIMKSFIALDTERRGVLT
jgi:hypothetical protein